MALEKTLKRIFWTFAMEKSTVLQNALELYHSDQRATELLEVESCGFRRFGRPAATFSHSIKRKKGWAKNRAHK